ncbi:hypothetical protein Ancab_003207 [Ancistrocladus abbreviatus]
MECVVALKGAFLRPEMMGFGMKQPLLQQQYQQQLLGEDLWALNGQQNGGAGDDFFVDQLLNLNNEEITEDGLPAEEVVQDQKHNSSASLSPPLDQQTEKREIVKDDFGSVLTVPADEADLEWLSHFVEDSFSEFSTPYTPGTFSGRPKKEPEREVTAQTPCLMTPVLTKARGSRRARSGGRVWSFASPSLTTESTTTTTTSSSSSTSSSPPSPSCTPLVLSNIVHQNPEPASKKQKKTRHSCEGGSGSSGTQPPRRCSHCGVQKTPQWRTGPMGAKTLCNACGVRYKSGRLLPEYRPACSPTFSSEIHSNNHRKVLEMRRKKELMMMVGRPDSGLAPPPPAPSFG